MTTTELHNMLLQHWLQFGSKHLREDFDFESIFPQLPCQFCNNGEKERDGMIKFCCQCGRKLKESKE